MARFTHFMTSAALAIAMTLGVHGQDTGSPARGAEGDTLYDTIKAMQDEMERLRRDNEAMKDQIDDLRARTEDDWLTEARAREIRGLVEDVLADADTRANLMQDGIMAGWSEHFFMADAFGRFLLQVDGMVQFRYVLNYRDQSDRLRSGFETRRARLTFRGHVFDEDIQYLVRGEFSPYPQPNQAAGVFGLLDAWVRYNLTNNWSIRVGQFKLPFTREELVSSAHQLAVDRSLVHETFAIGRSQGIELAYHDSANAWSIALSDGATFRSGSLFTLQGISFVPGANVSAIGANVEYAITSRYERLLAGTWQQFHDFTSPPGEEFGMLFGFAAHVQNPESSSDQIIGGTNENWLFTATADFSVEWGGANAFVAVMYQYLDATSATIDIVHTVAVVGQAGVYLTPKWEAFVRGEWAQFEVRGAGTAQIPDVGLATVGVNYYIEGHDVKWTNDIGWSFTEISAVWSAERTGWRDVSDNGRPEIVFRSQLQLLF